MSIVHFIVVCLIVGVVLWLINTYVPMDARVKRVMSIGVVILLVLWLVLTVLGVTNLGAIRVG